MPQCFLRKTLLGSIEHYARNFLLTLNTYLFQSMSPLSVLFFVSYIIGSLTIIGLLLECNRCATMLEVLRCVALLLLVHHCTDVLRDPILSPTLLKAFYIVSASFWACRSHAGLKSVPQL